jgi:Fur family ferric uptake transcriptional regulator
LLPPVQVSQSPENKFREYLASRPRAQRFTNPQRQMVRFIFSTHNHFDAEQLCKEMVQAGLDVSRATVYRTLNKLVDAGLLRRLQLGERVAYEHDYGYPQHDHLHCERCGKVLEFQSPEIEAALQRIAQEHRFRASTYNLVIHGTCDACNLARMTKRRLDLV